MLQKDQKKLFFIATCICIVILTIAYYADLTISQWLINYNSWYGTLFQTFGEFPLYMLFVVSGQVAMKYAFCIDNKLFTWSLFRGGLGLAAWQTKEYVNEVLGYIASICNNIAHHKAIGLANSDEATRNFSQGIIWIVWAVTFVIITGLAQWWLNNKSDAQLKKYMRISVFATLTAWFALQVNQVLKTTWGRVRPYELSSKEHFTNWLTINGDNGHKSFPSGHTMAATVGIMFSWFATGNKRKLLWIGGIIYGILMGISRIIIGAHFTSDVTFSFFITALIIYIMEELLTEFEKCE